MFRHLLSSLRQRFTQPLRPHRGCQYHSNAKSSSNTYAIRNSAEQTRSPASESFVTPTAFLGLGVVGGFSAFAYYLHYNDTKRAIPKGQGKGQQGVAPAGAAIGGPFTLVNTENQVFTDQDFGGEWVLLYFGYTSSPETGPAEIQKMANTINILESKQDIKVLPVFVTLDPNRDSTSQLKAYLKEFHPRIVGLTGTNAAVKDMARQYRVYFRKVEEDVNDYLVECSHNLYLINPNKEIVRSFGLQSGEEERSKDILKEINRSKAHITE